MYFLQMAEYDKFIVEKGQYFRGHLFFLFPIQWQEVKFMNACELTTAVTALANALACEFSEEELTLIASVLVQLGDTLVTIVTRNSICKEKTS